MTPPPADSGATSDRPAPNGEPSGTPGATANTEQRSATAQPTPASTSLLQRLKGWLDLVLVADVFLVIAAALWFALAVLLHSRGVEAPLQLFQQLWEPLFTPAIGLLMAAALLSGALGWWQRRGQR
jgi:hypothetical protein